MKKRHVWELSVFVVLASIALVFYFGFVRPAVLSAQQRADDYAREIGELKRAFESKDQRSADLAENFLKKFGDKITPETKAKILYNAHQALYGRALADFEKFLKSSGEPNFTKRPDIEKIRADITRSIDLLKKVENESDKYDWGWRIKTSKGNAIITKLYIDAVYLNGDKNNLRRDLLEAKSSLEKAKTIAESSSVEKLIAQNLDFATRITEERVPERVTGAGLGGMLSEDSNGDANRAFDSISPFVGPGAGPGKVKGIK